MNLGKTVTYFKLLLRLKARDVCNCHQLGGSMYWRWLQEQTVTGIAAKTATGVAAWPQGKK
jgi:hypothetical protein